MCTFGRLLRSPFLNDELIELEFLRGPLQDAFLNGVLYSDQLILSPQWQVAYLCYEAEDKDLLGLPYPMCSVHRLQVCLRVPDQTISSAHSSNGTVPHQSLSKSTTMSAVTRLIPRPPARVVRRKTNFSLPGALYSSIAVIRSS